MRDKPLPVTLRCSRCGAHVEALVRVASMLPDGHTQAVSVCLDCQSERDASRQTAGGGREREA